jgi:hypothetical protein
MNWAGRGVAIIVLVSSVVGCNGDIEHNREEGDKLVRSVGAPVLAVEAGQLKRLAPSGTSVLVERGAWPQGIMQLRPQEVRVTPTGVFVQRFKEPQQEQGVFIAYAGVIVRTEPDRNPAFTPIDGQVYSYNVKR